jgi:hypothetical protein
VYEWFVNENEICVCLFSFLYFKTSTTFERHKMESVRVRSVECHWCGEKCVGTVRVFEYHKSGKTALYAMCESCFAVTGTIFEVEPVVKTCF